MPSASVPIYDSNSYTPPKVVILRQDRINYVLNGVCSYYNLPLDLLRAQSRGRVGKRRKMMTIKLLRDLADISFKEIKYAFNNKSEQSIWASYTAISEDINYGGNNSTKQEYELILKHLNL